MRKGHARAWGLLPVMAVQGLSHLALLWAGTGHLPPAGGAVKALLVGGAGASGVAFGATWPLVVILTSEIFGRTHLMKTYMLFDGFAGSVGAVRLASLLRSYVYEQAAKGSAATCYGQACFAPTHIVISSRCVGRRRLLQVCW